MPSPLSVIPPKGDDFFGGAPEAPRKFKTAPAVMVAGAIIFAVLLLGAVGIWSYKQLSPSRSNKTLPISQSQTNPESVAVPGESEEEYVAIVNDYLNEIARKPFPAKNIRADQAIAQIKILSKKSEAEAWPAKYEIKIERIGEYYRYSEAQYPSFQVGDIRVVYITAFYDYNSPSPSLENTAVGESYPAYITVCHERQVVCPEGDWINLFPAEKILRVTNLKIVSPAQGSTVRIGEALLFKVAVDDSLQRDVFYTTPWAEHGYIKAPNYEARFIIPTTYEFGGRPIELKPGQRRLGVVGGDKASSDEVFINLVK